MSKGSRSNSTILTGIVKRHPDGFGFLVPDQSEAPDVYIPRHEMSGVMGNDRVELKLHREPGGKRWRGEIREILARAVKRVTGRYEDLGGGKGCLRDHSFAWGADVSVKNPSRLAIKPGDWVAVDLLTYPDAAEGLTGQVVAVIGNIQDPANDSVRILHMHNIPHEFSRAALVEADALPAEVRPSDIQGRKDLRALKFITIDGRTAKDFDDAIYVENAAQGFKLWVAIADVSHYVKPGTAIDEAAYERGTSTYFPNFVAPMLPEKLSNELCSLKPKVDRLALVAEMNLNFQGVLERSHFYEAVIQSQARVTYGEAQEVLDSATPESLRHVEDVIRRAGDLAKILMQKRFREGSLDLEIPETEIEVDDSGQPVDILQSSRLFAHRLIEEMMLMANVAVAKAFSSRSIPALYRIHEQPNPRSMEGLANFLETLGSVRPLEGTSLQKKITRALQDFADHPQEHILHILTLRSMAQAQYSPENVGHFGLGFSDYAHFTSPIRRYPDLMIHRQLKALFKMGRGYGLQSVEELATAGSFLSACEQRSVKAERQIKTIKKARFMARHLGEEFDGLITSVTRFGVFVLLRQFDVDGLVRLENLPGDRFEFDEQNMRLVGQRSGRVIALGDPMRVLVAAADQEDGRIDFMPAEATVGAGKPRSLADFVDARAGKGRENGAPASEPRKGFRGRSDQKKNKSFSARRKTKGHSRGVRPERVSSRRRKG